MRLFKLFVASLVCLSGALFPLVTWFSAHGLDFATIQVIGSGVSLRPSLPGNPRTEIGKMCYFYSQFCSCPSPVCHEHKRYQPDSLARMMRKGLTVQPKAVGYARSLAAISDDMLFLDCTLLYPRFIWRFPEMGVPVNHQF